MVVSVWLAVSALTNEMRKPLEHTQHTRETPMDLDLSWHGGVFWLAVRALTNEMR